MSFSLYPYTNYEDLNLDYIFSKIKDLVGQLDKVDELDEKFTEIYNEISELYNQIISGNFPQPIKDAFAKWMQDNALDLVGNLVHNVFFGLTKAGYFVVYIPESWNDIIFNTSGLDVNIPDVEYGHLILSY